MVGPLAYIGGKNRLAAKIISLLPEHTAYVEPFAGGAQVFFHKRPSEVEVLNDLDGEIVNLLRVCQWHHSELIRYLKYRSEEHTSELQSLRHLVCRLLLEKKKKIS